MKTNKIKNPKKIIITIVVCTAIISIIILGYLLISRLLINKNQIENKTKYSDTSTNKKESNLLKVAPKKYNDTNTETEKRLSLPSF